LKNGAPTFENVVKSSTWFNCSLCWDGFHQVWAQALLRSSASTWHQLPAERSVRETQGNGTFKTPGEALVVWE